MDARISWSLTTVVPVTDMPAPTSTTASGGRLAPVIVMGRGAVPMPNTWGDTETIEGEGWLKIVESIHDRTAATSVYTPGCTGLAHAGGGGDGVGGGDGPKLVMPAWSQTPEPSATSSGPPLSPLQVSAVDDPAHSMRSDTRALPQTLRHAPSSTTGTAAACSVSDSVEHDPEQVRPQPVTWAVIPPVHRASWPAAARGCTGLATGTDRRTRAASFRKVRSSNWGWRNSWAACTR